MGFFEGGARGLADLISQAFKKHGRPVGFIKGQEGSGALVVGLRYGEGMIHLKNGQKAQIYWQNPSVGLDLGVNASKVFCLVYNMTDINQIYQRYPGVDGRRLRGGRLRHDLPAVRGRHPGPHPLRHGSAARGRGGLHALHQGTHHQPLLTRARALSITRRRSSMTTGLAM